MIKWLVTLMIPYPKILIKYHKAINKKEVFSTMLVIPATNFTATFSKIGYLRIKKNSGQGKGKLITRLRCTIILPEVETGIVRDKKLIEYDIIAVSETMIYLTSLYVPESH